MSPGSRRRQGTGAVPVLLILEGVIAMRVPKQSWGAFVAVLLLAGSGCRSGLVKVRGVVTLDGKPAEGVTVLFTSSATEGPPAQGLTASDGTFFLTTFTTGDGAKPGDYKVLISHPEPPYVTGHPPAGMNE